ncbi:aminotransferase class IV [Halorubrum halodurans]|uniref:4-amino-4-deoxychorismate lyase n=1 Tax=Halorubrum halodurans TaxID=1383851 RepID=A0A256IDP7_9EURY|nr:aminotransferase class IV [Halorubrum halodurans]OYR54669.1 4-amino-4-deoxychorismate lyase [Halorubrum halodurans]
MTGDADRRYHVDGEIVPAESATVRVDDRGFRYGDAAAETVRAYGGVPFRWDRHADRLARSCEALSIEHGLSDAALRDRVDETLEANDLTDAVCEVSITRGRPAIGAGPGGGPDDRFDPRIDGDPTVVVTARPLPRGGVDAEPVSDAPATLQTVKTRRTPDRAVPADATTHARVNELLARLELRVTGADEALLSDADGHVVGGADSTLFFTDGKGLRTPALDGPVVPRVARAEVIGIAEAEGVPVEEGSYAPSAVREADEVFLANATWGIRPVRTVDGIAVDGDGEDVAGPLTTLLSRLFDRRVEAACYDDRS